MSARAIRAIRPWLGVCSALLGVALLLAALLLSQAQALRHQQAISLDLLDRDVAQVLRAPALLAPAHLAALDALDQAVVQWDRQVQALPWVLDPGGAQRKAAADSREALRALINQRAALVDLAVLLAQIAQRPGAPSAQAVALQQGLQGGARPGNIDGALLLLKGWLKAPEGALPMVKVMAGVPAAADRVNAAVKLLSAFDAQSSHLNEALIDARTLAHADARVWSPALYGWLAGAGTLLVMGQALAALRPARPGGLPGRVAPMVIVGTDAASAAVATVAEPAALASQPQDPLWRQVRPLVERTETLCQALATELDAWANQPAAALARPQPLPWDELAQAAQRLQQAREHTLNQALTRHARPPLGDQLANAVLAPALPALQQLDARLRDSLAALDHVLTLGPDDQPQPDDHARLPRTDLASWRVALQQLGAQASDLLAGSALDRLNGTPATAPDSLSQHWLGRA